MWGLLRLDIKDGKQHEASGIATTQGATEGDSGTPALNWPHVPPHDNAGEGTAVLFSHP